MKAPNPIAITAAVLFTTVSLLAISPNTPKVAVTEINGAKVINLAPVEVHPTADDRRAAALLTDRQHARSSTRRSLARPKAAPACSERNWPCPTIRLVQPSSAASARNNPCPSPGTTASRSIANSANA